MEAQRSDSVPNKIFVWGNSKKQMKFECNCDENNVSESSEKMHLTKKLCSYHNYGASLWSVSWMYEMQN